MKKRKLANNDLIAYIKNYYSLNSLNNFVPTADFFHQISDKEGSVFEWSNHFAILLYEEGFLRLYYMLQASISEDEMNEFIHLLGSILKNEEISIVCEYVSKNNGEERMELFLKNLGFESFINRERMRLTAKNALVQPKDNINDLYFLEPQYATYLLTQYYKTFDPYTSMIPTLEALEQTITQKNIIGVKRMNQNGNMALAGALEFSIDRKTSSIMHFVVFEEFRGMGLARVLLEQYLNGVIIPRNLTALLWVKCDNSTAKYLYSSYGYTADNLYAKSYILAR